MLAGLVALFLPGAEFEVPGILLKRALKEILKDYDESAIPMQQKAPFESVSSNNSSGKAKVRARKSPRTAYRRPGLRG